MIINDPNPKETDRQEHTIHLSNQKLSPILSSQLVFKPNPPIPHSPCPSRPRHLLAGFTAQGGLNCVIQSESLVGGRPRGRLEGLLFGEGTLRYEWEGGKKA